MAASPCLAAILRDAHMGDASASRICAPQDEGFVLISSRSVGKAKRPRECAVDGVPTIPMCRAAGSVAGNGAKGAFIHPTAAPILTHMGERRTHNPCGRWLRKMSTPMPKGDDTAYGSRRFAGTTR